MSALLQPPDPAKCHPDALHVQVWDYPRQRWVKSWRCPGEARVRIDEDDALENYAVFQVDPRPDGSFVVLDGNKPLRHWRVDRT